MRLRAAAAAIGLAAVPCTIPAAAQTIGGRYAVTGTNPNGSHYAGTADIVPQRGGACRMSWQVGSIWNGVCVVASHSLGAVYRSGETVGIVVYDLEPDGSLRGVWTLGNHTGTETLTPAK